MASKNKFHAFKRDIDRNSVEENKSILIVCEGEKTEPLYFDSFDVYSVSVKVKGTGKNTVTLVDEALRYKNEYDEIWCVFDKDSFQAQQFNNACQKAKSNGLKLAYSNESFELWYILHFQFLQSQLNRKQYITTLNQEFSRKFNRQYRKNDSETYELLKDYQNTAIKNAKRLTSFYSQGTTPANQFPVTYVYELVEELNRWSRKNRW